jgi:hypothetical protein
MSRFTSLRTPGQLLVAVAVLVSWEGLSYARTTTQPLRATIEANATEAKSAGSNPDAVVQPTIADPVARARVCHISRHPRDGVPATEHACPLVVADATDAVAPESAVALAN